MCFSAIASFTASALLTLTGLYSVKTAAAENVRYLPLAMVPLCFGAQQGLEGLVWLGLHHSNETLVQTGSVGYLFFSHGFWPVWIPLSAFWIEQQPKAQRAIASFIVAGLLFSISLYVPMMASNGFDAAINHGSIDYQTHIIYDALWPRDVSRLIYLALVVLPMWIADHWGSRIFAGLAALSLVATYGAFNYAFVSVWCFFAALLSFYIVYLIHANASLLSTGLPSAVETVKR